MKRIQHHYSGERRSHKPIGVVFLVLLLLGAVVGFAVQELQRPEQVAVESPVVDVSDVDAEPDVPEPKSVTEPLADDQPAWANRVRAFDNARPGFIVRAWTERVAGEGLVSPDGVAVHPIDGAVYVVEEDASRVVRLRQQEVEAVISRDTPVYYDAATRAVRAQGLQGPEPLAFAPDGTLYVAEDRPGGRVLRFAPDANGAYSVGEVVALPAGWEAYAWEGLDISAEGSLLLAGSDIEHVGQQAAMDVFSGAILYRDSEGRWWVPYRRFFASYSNVRFSETGRQAVYVCEVTGEIGWLDLSRPLTRGGQSQWAATSPEGVALLPDGTLVVAEEGGRLLHIDAVSDEMQVLESGLGAIESVVWDARRQRLLVSSDGSGQVLALHPDNGFDDRVDMLLYAAYHPAFSQQQVPDQAPDYLARILSLGGMDVNAPGRTGLGLREFVKRVPLVAADLKAVSMNDAQTIADPVERVQFVIFQPNRMDRPTAGDSGAAFSIFGVRTASGEFITTTALPVRVFSTSAGRSLNLEAPDTMDLMTVPNAAAVSVSGIGVAAVQFLGMGKTPDFSLVLNPQNPADSYMVVFHRDGRRDHYRLESATGSVRQDWVIAYSSPRQDKWIRLPDPGAELETDAADAGTKSAGAALVALPGGLL